MSTTTQAAPAGSIAAQAQLALADLAIAARTGQLTAAAVLEYTARIGRHLVTLAEYEAVCDEEAAEACDAARARHEAIATGAALPFPTRPRLYTGTGGGRAA